MLERIARPLRPGSGRARVASSRAAIIALLSHGLKAALLSLTLVGGLSSTTGAYAQDAAKAESDLRQLRARIARLDREMASDSQTRKSLSKQIEASEKDLAQKASAARRAEQKLAEQKQEVEKARAAQTMAREQVEKGRKDLTTALRASYMAGSPGPLQMLFSVDQASALQRLDVDTAAVAQALQARLDQLQDRIKQLARAEKSLLAQVASLEKNSEASRKALAALKKSQSERQTRLSDLKKRSSERTVALALARAQQAKVEKLLDELRSALKDSPMKYERGVPFKSQRGKLPWPLRGSLLAKFGTLKNGGPLSWSGWWIKADNGAPVRAVSDGRVVYVGWVQRYGLVVIIDHAGPYLSLYGHLQEAIVEVGKVVSAGTRIASAGASGGHDRSGVYFEIREGSTTVDPKRWLVP